MWRSSPIAPNAGAVMDVETGEMKLKADAMAVNRHRAAHGQFFGFAASSGPSQVTYE